MVNRVVTPTVPITVEYTLTGLGRTLIDAFASLRQWSEVNFLDVTAAQTRFDQRQY
jgi:DNA-binding HxlR family transcriptional regulator